MPVSASLVAVNPLPWTLRAEGFSSLAGAALPSVLDEIREAGYLAVMAEVPAGMPLGAYRAALEDADLRPAPGYFAASFEDGEALSSTVARARECARLHRELGLSEVFVAGAMVPARLAAPAVGAAFDHQVLASFTRNLQTVGEAMAAEGVLACIHPHVGSLVETEAEVRHVLDHTDPAAVAFGPDTGHLFWGGTDPAAVIEEYADRVGAVHLKDVHQPAVVRARRTQATYGGATLSQHLWTELGRGDVDLRRVVSVLAGRFAGWWIVEVDVPDEGLAPAESSARSAAWVAENLTHEHEGARR